MPFLASNDSVRHSHPRSRRLYAVPDSEKPNTSLVPSFADETTVLAAAQQFILFRIEQQMFAAEVAALQEIICMPELDLAPLAPPALLGIGNLRGTMLPILCLRRLLRLDAQVNSTQRILVMMGYEPVGIAVDEVLGVDLIPISHIERSALFESSAAAPVIGTIRQESGTVILLNLPLLLQQELPQLRPMLADIATTSARALREKSHAAERDEQRMICYRLDGQEYATPICQVAEILPLTATFMRLPQAGSSILGIMSLRGQLLSLVCLRHLLGLAEPDEPGYVIVLPLGEGRLLGMVVDSVQQVLSIARRDIDSLPEPSPSVTSGFRRVCRLDAGRRLLGLIEADQLADRLGLVREPESVWAGHSTTAAISAMEEEYVVFQIARQCYGLPVDKVQEIVSRPAALMQIADRPAHIEGYFDLRGKTIPVLDLRRYLGKPATEPVEGNCIIVLLLENTYLGLIVDQVTEMLRIPADTITPAPGCIQSQWQIVERVANLADGQRLIQLLSLPLLRAGQLAAAELMAMKS